MKIQAEATAAMHQTAASILKKNNFGEI